MMKIKLNLVKKKINLLMKDLRKFKLDNNLILKKQEVLDLLGMGLKKLKHQ